MFRTPPPAGSQRRSRTHHPRSTPVPRRVANPPTGCSQTRRCSQTHCGCCGEHRRDPPRPRPTTHQRSSHDRRNARNRTHRAAALALQALSDSTIPHGDQGLVSGHGDADECFARNSIVRLVWSSACAGRSDGSAGHVKRGRCRAGFESDCAAVRSAPWRGVRGSKPEHPASTTRLQPRISAPFNPRQRPQSDPRKHRQSAALARSGRPEPTRVECIISTARFQISGIEIYPSIAQCSGRRGSLRIVRAWHACPQR